MERWTHFVVSYRQLWVGILEPSKSWKSWKNVLQNAKLNIDIKARQKRGTCPVLYAHGVLLWPTTACTNLVYSWEAGRQKQILI